MRSPPSPLLSDLDLAAVVVTADALHTHPDVAEFLVPQRLLALAAAVWFNCQLGVQHKRSLVAYDSLTRSNRHQ